MSNEIEFKFIQEENTKLHNQNTKLKEEIQILKDSINELKISNQEKINSFEKNENLLKEKYENNIKELKTKNEKTNDEKILIENSYKIKMNELEKEKKILELENKTLNEKIENFKLNEINIENENKIHLKTIFESQKKTNNDYEELINNLKKKSKI